MTTIKIKDFRATNGNKKIGMDTLIINMGPAITCPADKIGLCGLGKNGNGKCYAMKPEMNLRKKYVLPHRQKQERYWLSHTKEQINKDMAIALYSNVHITTVRYNESGDMHGPDCLEKMVYIARQNPDTVFYTYTHRSDIMGAVKISDLPKNLTINLSYSNRKKGFNSYIIVPKGDKKINCVMDCRHCHLCKSSKNLKIYTAIH